MSGTRPRLSGAPRSSEPRRARIVAALAAPLLAGVTAACGGAPGEPEPDEVSISLDLTGGFAGVDYAFTIEGASGEVTVDRCRTGCEGGPGEVIAGLERREVEALSGRLVAAGFLAFHRRDHGRCEECADQRRIVLTYRVRGAAHVALGDEPLLPAAVRGIVLDIERAVEAGRHRR